MKLINNPPLPCRCRERIAAFLGERGTTGLRIGSIIECDCGKQYKLTDDQRDGPYWAKIEQDHQVGALA